VKKAVDVHIARFFTSEGFSHYLFFLAMKIERTPFTNVFTLCALVTAFAFIFWLGN